MRDAAQVQALIGQDKSLVNKPINDRNDTALHFAIYNDDLETVKVFLKAGANSEAPNKKNLTAAELAKHYKRS